MSDLSIYSYSLLTILLFIIGLKTSKKLKSSILNPFILSLLITVSVLVIFNIPFKQYYQGNLPINQLLGVSVVALAVPFYEHLPQLIKHWRKIAILALASTLFTMITGVLFALALGASQDILLALLPKSVTTAIAVSITKEMGGNPALSAIAVSIAGIIGSAFGIAILKWVKVTNTRAIGLSMGAVSHALGTARTMEYSIKAGSYASVALVLCGILSSIFAPFVFQLVLKCFY